MNAVSETKTEKMIEPRNGVVSCGCCNVTPSRKEKVGDPCPACVSWFTIMQRSPAPKDAVFSLDKRTILGPVHTVVATGNPLLDAANVLKVDGWLHGQWVCGEGKKCLAGAVRAACGLFSDPDMEEEKFAEKYVKTNAYQAAIRRYKRAIFSLAVQIEKIQKVREEERHAIIDNAFFDIIDVVVDYNDFMLSNEDGRRKALQVLRAAAKHYNPRLRIR